jgi:hypothetical protein
MRALVCTCIYILAMALPGAAQTTKLPMPAIEGITAWGCRIERIGAGAWRLYGWADHGGSAEPGQHDWLVWLSERSGRTGEKKAFGDCRAFMGAVEKAVKAKSLSRSDRSAWAAAK